MKLNQKKFYICWSPRILPLIFDAGFKLWEDPKNRQDNPFLDLKKRYNARGELLSPKTGYIFLRTPALMSLVSLHSKPQANKNEYRSANHTRPRGNYTQLKNKEANRTCT